MGGQPSKEDEDLLNAEEEEKKRQRKEAKYQKKKDAQYQAEVEKEEARKAKAAKKLEAQKARKAEAKKEAEAAKAAQPKVVEAEAPAPAESGKKKKKKKKKKKGGAAAAAAVETAPEPVVEDEGWTTMESSRPKKKSDESSGPSVEAEMLVNPRHYTTIIGPAGATRMKLEDACGVRLNLPKKGSSSEKIQISGAEDNVQKCKDAINELIDKGYSKILDGNMDDVKMVVSNLGILIGPAGSTIRTIQSRTNTKITLPEKGAPREDKKGKTITILGDSENVKAAQAAITQLMKDGFSPMTHEGWSKTKVGFPASMVSILLGPKGSNIRKIQDESGARINVPDVKGEDKALIEITIVGPGEGVSKACASIAAVQTDFVNTEMDFPAVFLPFLMGEKGATIRGIQTSTKTRIDVREHLWDPSQRCVAVAGFTKDVEAAKAEIIKIAASNTTWRFDFPENRVYMLIGKGGSGIKKLRQSTGCRIDINDHDWDDLVKEVVVIGPPAGVEAAKAEIEQKAVPPPKKEKPVEEAKPAEEAAPAETSS